MSRRFSREAKVESRVHCSCELCRLRFGRLFEVRRHRGRWRRFQSLRFKKDPIYGLKGLTEDLSELIWG